jgi:DNA-binding NtrC family response regulator
MNRPRVLVVEDRPSVLKLMATILEVGYQVTTASDGATALSLVRSTPFDVVLTDIRMPQASGFDVLREVQHHAPHTRVVMMTAYANVPDAVAAMRLGAFDYVAKPLDADEIALVMARAAGHRHEGAGRPVAALPQAEAHAEEDAALQDASVGFRLAVEQARERASVEYLSSLMRQFHGNVTQAATRACMTRESLYRVLKQYGIHPDQYRDAARAGGHPQGEDDMPSEASG